ncbi:hypothetical protein J4734_22740 [Klebsiella pneumoniae]|uniref:Uncharacterized protein n=1 Tax=Klebsiella pneumoniae TaxID=573 RepID=A0A939NSM7_KLEPN|nr:hypothetical protein [Klebsiella pneumoniae]
MGESVQRWLYGSRYDHRRRLTFKGERRAHQCCDAVLPGHSPELAHRSWRGGMAMTRH